MNQAKFLALAEGVKALEQVEREHIDVTLRKDPKYKDTQPETDAEKRVRREADSGGMSPDSN